MKYTFYPGCSLGATAKDFCTSTLAMADKLGLELTELEGLDLLRLDRRAQQRPSAGRRTARAEPACGQRRCRGRGLRQLLQPAQDGQPPHR